MHSIAFETLLGFAATCLVIELTPGPNMAYLAVLVLVIAAGFVQPCARGLLALRIRTRGAAARWRACARQ